MCRFIALLLPAILVFGFQLAANVQVASQEPTNDEQASPSPEAVQPKSELTSSQELDAKQWIEELGSREFAVRERAATNLLSLGRDVVPLLSESAKNSRDAETRLRAGQIVKQLTDGDLQERIEAFLAGQEVGFAGWPIVQQNLGNGTAIRELFIEMMTVYPEATKLLDGTVRDRAIALEKVQSEMQTKFRTSRDDVNRADLFFMLILGKERELQGNGATEKDVIRSMRRPVVRLIRRDAQLTIAFESLLNRWLIRTSETNRVEILAMGMMQNIEATRSLALMTLVPKPESEPTSPDKLATAMQALFKFGEREDVDLVRIYLDDSRGAWDRMMDESDAGPQIRDLAMLTIAQLLEIPLDDVGMGHVESHPSAGFAPYDFAYMSDDTEKSRAAARKVIDAKLGATKEEAEGS